MNAYSRDSNKHGNIEYVRMYMLPDISRDLYFVDTSLKRFSQFIFGDHAAS